MAIENNSAYEFLLKRRSASILHDPKPERAEIEQILNIAATAPDHGNLKPYRFVVIEGDAREKFGDALVDSANQFRPEALEEKMKPKIKAKAFAAPMQILIIYSPVASEKIHAWEQMSTASCAGFGLVLGANALGFGAVWKSFFYDSGESLKKLCGMSQGEMILGWVNIGTEKERDHSARSPLDLSAHAKFLK
jgi:nitroreductase